MREWRRNAWLAAALLCFAPAASAQEQKPAEEKKEQESLAEAARRARGQRQSNASGKVWTNDNLPSRRGGITGEPGTAASPGSEATAGRAATEAEEQERAEAEKAVKEEKAHLEQLKRDLDLLQRDFDLAREQFYGSASYANDAAGQRRINDMQAQVDGKKTEIATSEAKVAELEQALAQVNERLGPKPETPLTPDEQRAKWADQLRPLQDELARVEQDLNSLRAQLPRSPAISPGAGNDPTRDRIAALEARRTELRQKISDIQDEARRAGTPPAWTRPPQ